MSALSKEKRHFLEKATLRYMEHLHEAADVLAARGIELDHARSNALGVVRDPLPQHSHLEGRLAIPYLTDYGPVNMSFRCLRKHHCKEEGCKKYKFMSGWPTNLYGVQSLTKADDWIAVTEGEIDALTLKQIGIPAVGVSGAEKWEDHWIDVFEDFSRVYIFTDGDSAGKGMWDKWSYELGNSAIRVKLPDGEDVNSIYVKHGKEPLWSGIKK